jgi:hypothetical protein
MKAPRRKPEPSRAQPSLPLTSEARTRAYSPELTAKLARGSPANDALWSPGEVRGDAVPAARPGGVPHRAGDPRGEEHRRLDRRDPRGGPGAEVSEPMPRVSAGDLPRAPDALSAWISSTLSPAVSSARRMAQGPTPETDAALDTLRVLRAWTARRLVN